MATRNNELEVKNLVRLAVNAFYDRKYANFSTKNLAACGIGEKKIQYYLKELCKDKELENNTVNGFYSRYKVVNLDNCPDFIFDDNLTTGQKLFLITCMEKLPDYEPRPSKEVASLLERESTSQVSKTMSAIKKSGRTIFEILNEMIYVQKDPSHETYDLLCTEFGYQIQTSNIQSTKEYKCQYCGTTNPDDFYSSHITCKHCQAKLKKEKVLSSPASFLLEKAKRGFKSRAYITEFTITEQDIVEQLNRQNNLDYYTKQKIDIEDMSLDRLDSSKGYIPGNIVITHKIINIMKNDLSINEFRTYITNLYNIDSF